MNVVTRGGGELRAELLDGAGAVIEGYSREDCRVIAGHEAAVTMDWNGGEPMPDTAMRIRFCLKRAFLYGFATKE